MTVREQILKYVKTEYDTDPEHPWGRYPAYEVLRHRQEPGEEKARWYGILMEVKRTAFGFDSDEYVSILNVKLDHDTIDFLRHVEGYYPAYHMNKQSWITVLLDGTVSFDNIRPLIDESFTLTASAKEAKEVRRRGPKDWIVPANPKYFDLITAFRENEVIAWKQSSDIHVGDQIYMYVAVPYSALMYHCEAVEVDIPWNYEDRDLTVKKVMKIKLLASYEPDFMPFSRMKDEYGVYAVRGPRSLPDTLKQELLAYEGAKVVKGDGSNNV